MHCNSDVKVKKSDAHKAWKTIIPFRRIPKDKKHEFPVEHVGLFSYLVFAWLDSFMWKAFRNRIDVNRLWTCPEVDTAQLNADRLEELWEAELKKSGPSGASLFRVFISFVKKRWLVASLVLVISLGLLLFSVAYIMMNILHLTVLDEVELWHGLVLVGALFLASILSQLLFMASTTITHVAAGRLRSGILCLVFRKMMKSSSLHDKTIGRVVNLFSNDSLRVFEGISLGYMIISGPLLAIGSTAYAIYLLGAWALIGLFILLLLLPMQMIAGKVFMKFRGQAIVLTDTRVRMMTEYLANIRFIKMYSWEKALISMVEGARSAEQKILEKANISMGLLFMTVSILIAAATMCTLIAYTMTGHHLSSAQGFMYLLIYTVIQDKLEFAMYTMKLVSEMSIAAKRFQEVLLMDSDVSKSSAISNYNRLCHGENALELSDVAFRWPSSVAEIQPSENNHESNRHELEIPLVASEEQQPFGTFSLNIEKGHLVGIMGPVSSGKTSLIRAILGQMDVVKGIIQVGGSIAYVPQQPWIFSATVRENILLGSQYDEGRYKAILESCCLLEDLDVLVDRDLTEIGERGVTLSGGQKQRISLARALYSDREIYLLDDPLSAVDPDVAETIFSKVVLGKLLGKTVLLVTHHIKFFCQCDLIIRLSERQVVEVGSHEELMRTSSEYASLTNVALSDKGTSYGQASHATTTSSSSPQSYLLSSADSASSTKSPVSANPRDSAPAGEKSSPLMTEEEKAEGAIPFSTYLAYVRAAGGLPVVLIVLFVSLLAELTRAFSFWWLAHWLEDGSGGVMVNGSNETIVSDNISDNENLWMYNLVYGMSLIAIIIFFALRSVVTVKVLMRASSRLHSQLFRKVMRTPILFFDTTPLGRLINRFSRDMDEMDTKLPMMIESTVKAFLNILIYIVLIAIIMPWFLIAVFVTGVIFIILYTIFRAGVREVKRFQLISTSPLLSHVEATLRGLSSIQAYDKTTDFEVRLRERLDHNTLMLLLYHFTMRWVGVRLAFITTTLVSCTALLVFLLRNEIPTAYGGAAIIYAFQLLTLFQFFVRCAVDAGSTFVSVERIHSYATTLKEEGALVTKTFALPKEWPSKGQIKFSNLNLRHREGLPLVLDGISFLVASKEKIGIVGRTGSGKSSLVGALFRLVEACGGKVEIDDIDIALIGLEELRTKLSIIPQDPVLFSGTIRSNLDPFEHHNDEELWKALERCHLKDTVVQMEGQLSAAILENGDNISQGERQLLCMARVLLRHTRIIILDEATASLDDETEQKIQTTVTQTFAECTVLIIAHRLRTILSCDRVLVLDDGKVVEFDKPSSLLNNPESRLSQMVSVYESGISSDSSLEENALDKPLVWA